MECINRKIILMLTLIASTALKGWTQTFTETINKELTFKTKNNNNTLLIDNVSGDIVIEGYSGENVIIEVKKKLSARTDRLLNQAKSDLKLAIEETNDSIIIYIDGLCNCNCGGRYGNRRYNWNNCDNNYRYYFDFHVKVPERTNLELYTVNNGDIKVSNVNGEVGAKNVNGGIFLTGLTNGTEAHTINGDVEIKYKKNPTVGSRYYTLNGDLNVYYLPDLSADMSFKSYNGKFYTSFDISERLAAKLSKSERGNGKGITYKIEERTAVRVGNGGVALDFETFNGDIFIRKNQ